MGLQLGMKESSDVILRAINMVGDNLGCYNFHHRYSALGNQGFYTEIDNLDIAFKLEKISPDYLPEDHIFSLNIPYEYFNDNALPIDKTLNISPADHLEVKAEIRCMDAITNAYKMWEKSHQIFTTKDLIEIIRQAQIKLEKVKNINFAVAGNKKEIAEKYVEFWFTENSIPQTGGTFTDRFFPVNFNIAMYYDDVGNNTIDGLIGESKLRGKSRKDICLLRVTYLLYIEFSGWLHNKWPAIYNRFKGTN